MTNERYGKCDMCRYCVHDGDDWACMQKNQIVKAKDSCAGYRPGFCENCSYAEIQFGEGKCKLTGEGIYILGVCDDYDPCGRHSMDSQ